METCLTPTKPGEFFILHLITSLWGVEQVIQFLSPEQQLHAVRCYWITMVALMITRYGLAKNFPALNVFDELVSKYRSTYDTNTMTVRMLRLS